ncbi:glycosyltransferase [Aquibacillus saliphilus]|uniref:glycosyltransferase n=1 Tax=Aquibacillus saliphilus TaxID=1909422 RepID=UPI001CF0186D|nr:glycosyltransferase [Aquibacillus saliphilus]
MSVLFISNIEKSETEGIYKKVKHQAMAASRYKSVCYLVCKKNGQVLISKFVNGEEMELVIPNKKISSNNHTLYLNILLESKKIINDEVDSIYIRHALIPRFELLKLLLFAKKKNKKIIYEIPTYPYFGEQYKGSKNKVKTSLKLMVECILWPLIYILIDKCVVIRSNSNVKIYKKMFNITNGINTKLIKAKLCKYNDYEFQILGLGTIYNYHGYEKILYSIKNCDGKIGQKIIKFHIVGESECIEKLKLLTESLNIEDHIVFHGKRTGENLDEIFDNVDIAVGCLALYRRNADIDTTLKVIEYLVRGVPFITSGHIENVNPVKKTYIKIPNDNTPVNIKNLMDFADSLSFQDLSISREMAIKNFDWDYIMKDVLK